MKILKSSEVMGAAAPLGTPLDPLHRWKFGGGATAVITVGAQRGCPERGVQARVQACGGVEVAFAGVWCRGCRSRCMQRNPVAVVRCSSGGCRSATARSGRQQRRTQRRVYTHMSCARACRASCGWQRAPWSGCRVRRVLLVRKARATSGRRTAGEGGEGAAGRGRDSATEAEDGEGDGGRVMGGSRDGRR